MLTAVVLVARLILAAVFAVAGIAKLRDRAGTRRAVVAFGVPGSLAAPLALALPVAELVVAVLVLPASTQVVGAVGALLLLAVFSAAIALNLARGKSPDCHCFGQLHSAPATWRTVGRNVLLAALGVVVLGEALRGTHASFVSPVADLEPAVLLALAAGVVALGFAVAYFVLMRSYGRVLLRLDLLERRLAEEGIELEDDQPAVGLAPGTPAPRYGATDDVQGRGKPVLLLFTSADCAPCNLLAPSIEAWRVNHGDEVAIVTTEDEQIHKAFEVDATPSAVLIAADDTIASYLAQGAESVEGLLVHVLAAQAQAGLPVGSPVPALTLPTLTGGTLSFGDLAGEETVVLFWNPDCGYCRSLHEPLRAWEQRANGTSRRLVVVSSGSRDATAAEHFDSTVVLDPDFTAGEAFRAGGTPIAVLLDPRGKVASLPVAGEEAVLGLTESPGARPRRVYAQEGMAV